MATLTAAIALSLTIASASAGASLKEGVRQYNAENYHQALQTFSSLLTRDITPKQRARSHVYLGLIQFQYERHKDARRSFAEAMEHDASVRLPADAPRDARIMFRRAKRRHTKRNARVKRRPKPKPKRTEPPPGKAATVDPTKPPEPAPPIEAQVTPAPPPPASTIAVAPPPPATAAPVPPPPPAVQATPEPPPLVVTETPPEEGPNVLAWSLVGVGGASAIVGGVFAGLTASAQSRADRVIEEDGFALDYQDAINERNRNLAVSVSGFVAAAVSAGIGAVLLATD